MDQIKLISADFLLSIIGPELIHQVYIVFTPNGPVVVEIWTILTRAAQMGKTSDPCLRFRQLNIRRGYADLSARPKIIKQANLRVPLYYTQSHFSEWKNGTWPSKMGLSHETWDCVSPSPILFVTPRRADSGIELYYSIFIRHKNSLAVD